MKHSNTPEPLAKAPQPPDMTWQRRGLCREDPGMFDAPDQYATEDDVKRLNKAMLVCVQCPVSQECLAFGLASRGWGVFGGMLLRAGKHISVQRIGRPGRPPKKEAA